MKICEFVFIINKKTKITDPTRTVQRPSLNGKKFFESLPFKMKENIGDPLEF